MKKTKFDHINTLIEALEGCGYAVRVEEHSGRLREDSWGSSTYHYSDPEIWVVIPALDEDDEIWFLFDAKTGKALIDK